MYRFSFVLGLVLLTMSLVPLTVKGQGQRPVITFSGLVVSGDSSYGVPGVNVYVPKAGRGTSTNNYGYFNLPCLEGDSVVFSSVGYKPQYFKVVASKDNFISVIVDLKADTTILPEVEILPFPTEEMFKEAFLAMYIPENEDEKRMRKNLDEQVLAKMLYYSDMDGATNYKYYTQQNIVARQNNMMFPSIPLLNPFAWAEFIRSVKRGDLKRKEWQD